VAGAAERQAALAAYIFRGPDPDRDGVSAWTRADLCCWLEKRFAKTFHPSNLSRVLRRLDLSRQQTRAVHPQTDPKAQERFRWRTRTSGSCSWFMDEARAAPAGALAVPANVTLVHLPPYSPELNPVERVWLYLRERFLSLRVFKDYPAIVNACCVAWRRLVAKPGRIRSLCHQPWIKKLTS
jgi:hypothetical protein